MLCYHDLNRAEPRPDTRAYLTMIEALMASDRARHRPRNLRRKAGPHPYFRVRNRRPRLPEQGAAVFPQPG